MRLDGDEVSDVFREITAVHYMTKRTAVIWRLPQCMVLCIHDYSYDAYKIMVGKPVEKGSFGRWKYRKEDNMNIFLAGFTLYIS